MTIWTWKKEERNEEVRKKIRNERWKEVNEKAKTSTSRTDKHIYVDVCMDICLYVSVYSCPWSFGYSYIHVDMILSSIYTHVHGDVYV